MFWKRLKTMWRRIVDISIHQATERLLEYPDVTAVYISLKTSRYIEPPEWIIKLRLSEGFQTTSRIVADEEFMESRGSLDVCSQELIRRIEHDGYRKDRPPVGAARQRLAK